MRLWGVIYIMVTNYSKEYLTEIVNSKKGRVEIASILNCAECTVTRILKRNGLSLSKRKYDVNESFFEKIDTPEKAYFLGWLASDGTVGKCGYIFSLYIQERDEDIIPLLLNLCNSTHKIRTLSNDRAGEMFKTHQSSKGFSIGSKKMVSDLRRMGLNEKKSYNISWPPIPESLDKYFLRGYFEGDGSLSRMKLNGAIIFSLASASPTIIKNLKDKIYLYTGVDIPIHIKKGNPLKKTVDLHCIIKQGDSSIVKVMDWLYSGEEHLKLNRKYNKYLECKEFQNTKGTKPLSSRRPRKVGQFDLNHNLIEVFISTRDVETKKGYGHSTISRCCLNKMHRSYGFIWKYLD